MSFTEYLRNECKINISYVLHIIIIIIIIIIIPMKCTFSKLIF
jgi:hypothetical protein